MSDPIHDRGKQMEDLFFKKQDQALIEKMRAQREACEHREQLIQASGISDVEVIDALVASGVTADCLTAVSVIPLVAVAWADRKMEEDEVDAVLKAAHSVGIDADSPSHQLLAQWLKTKPSDELLDAWKGYISAVKEKIDETALNQLKASVLGRAESVANAAGGFLGLVNKTSLSEQLVLDELAKAFQ